MRNLYSKFSGQIRGILSIVLCMTAIVCAAEGYAQNRVTGKVTDNAGQPVIGASVILKGTSVGTTTGADGSYTLSNSQINGQSVIVYSFIGYETVEEHLRDRSVINVILPESAIAIEGVVAIGYGTVKKTDLTGSVSTVTAENLVAKGTASVMGALQGAAPGVVISQNSTRPGSGFNIQIRGQNSISGGNPLYVVDGVVVDNIDFLNPADIERIDILKDASSTAIFGSRGSNGVVIVQTKSAKDVKSRITVSYDGYYGIRELARLPEFMDGRQWTDFRTSRYYDWNNNTQAYTITDANKIAITQNGKKVLQSLYDQKYTDWLGLATKTGSQQNHYVSVSGSGSDINYNIGMGFQKELGNFHAEQMERYTIKGSVANKASKFFNVGANFTLAHQYVNEGSQNGYRDFMRMPVVLPAYDSEGKIIEQPGIAASIEGAGNFTSSPNPLIEVAAGQRINKRFDVLAGLFFEVTPFNGFSVRTSFSPRLQQTQAAYYYGRTPDRKEDEAQTRNTTALEWTWDNQITYANSFGKHNINATAIASLYKTQSEHVQVRANNFPYVSDWYNIFNGTLVTGGLSSGYTQTQLASFSGRVNYDFASKYFVTGTVRYDGSSKLGTDHKWALFPSAALAWRLSQEEWLKHTDWLDNLKLRLSYGKSGNNNGVSAYGALQTPNTGSRVYYDFEGNVISGFAPGAPVNTALTWEKTREWDLGVDFGFIRNRISGSIDIYDKLSSGLLMKRTLTIESGVASMMDNIGSVNNRGLEVALNTQNIVGKEWSWNTSFTFSTNKNSIRELYGKKEDVIGEKRFIGEPINVIYDYKINGVWSQAEWSQLSAQQKVDLAAERPGYAKKYDLTGEGIISTADRMILGSPDPKYIFGITSNLSWRNIDFSFNIYGSQGLFIDDRFLQEYGVAANNQRGRPKVVQDYYIPTNAPRINWTDWNLSGGFPQVTWGTVPEHVGKVPNNGYTGNFYGNNGSYQDASFIKIRNITVGYTFPARIINKIKLSSARIYFNVLNPFIFTDYVGWDPEYATTTLDNGNGPSTVTYQVGINLKF